MIKINLLPYRAAKKLENIRMQISVYVLCIVLCAAVLGFYFLRLNSELNEMSSKNAQLNKELASYSELLKRVDELKRKRDDLKGKLEVIQRLEAQKAGPVQLFDEISIAVPRGNLFLKSLSESGSDVKMTGIAKDYDTVALFMTKLEETKTIKAVTLGSTSKSEVEGKTVTNFTLSCTKDLGDAAPKQDKAKVQPKKGGKK
jgi:type IV pilus assembly protein PilN